MVLVSKTGWQDLEGIRGTQIVNNLYLLKVPSLGMFTQSILHIAMGTDQDNKMLSVSGNQEVQIKVSAVGDEAARLKHRLEAVQGVQVMFNYKLPVTGTEEDGKTQFCLCVQVLHLLNVIRELATWTDVDIEQIYDFWN